MVIHYNSNNDYDFIINALATELESQFECRGENTKNYIIFSVPIKKENEYSKATKK